MTKVYAVRVHEHGGPNVLRYEQVDVGKPGPGEARVRHAAVGLNYTDIHFRTGRYPLKEFPHVIGMEAAGVVEEIGPGVTEVRVGDRVGYASEKPRAYAQMTVMPVVRLIRLPDFIDDETAAGAMLKGLTAQYLLRGAYAVKAGETILVHAAAGGVGLIMCQWAKHLGVRVIGTVSTDEKAALAKQNGCEHPIVYTKEDVVARVRELTGGEGLPVVYDGVGAATFEQSLHSLKRRGLLVSYGSAGGVPTPLEIFRLNRLGSLYLTSAGLADYIHDRAEMLARAQDLFDVMKIRAVRVGVRQRYPLAEAELAHRDLEAHRTIGSSILIP
jgi:NADPH2:quinone reductase